MSYLQVFLYKVVLILKPVMSFYRTEKGEGGNITMLDDHA